MPGKILKKTNSSIEVGKQWDVFSLGIVAGESRLNELSDLSTTYSEIRSHLNIFQQGKFANIFTIGTGYVADQDHTMLLEIDYSMEYLLSDQFHISINAGQYFYSGNLNNTNETFVGLSIKYLFKQNKTNGNKN